MPLFFGICPACKGCAATRGPVATPAKLHQECGSTVLGFTDFQKLVGVKQSFRLGARLKGQAFYFGGSALPSPRWRRLSLVGKIASRLGGESSCVSNEANEVPKPSRAARATDEKYQPVLLATRPKEHLGGPTRDVITTPATRRVEMPKSGTRPGR